MYTDENANVERGGVVWTYAGAPGRQQPLDFKKEENLDEKNSLITLIATLGDFINYPYHGLNMLVNSDFFLKYVKLK